MSYRDDVVSKGDVLELVLKKLPGTDKGGLVVLLDSQPKPRGEKVRVGLREVSMPFEGYYVFADLVPKANWGHPVAYFLIDAENGNVVQINENFPPFSGDPPANFVKLLDSRTV